jgi:hypothetical protein
MKVSYNFTLEELIRSDTAIARKLDNTPPEEAVRNLQALAANTLQPIRELWGKPVTVNSGYRSLALNRIIGGVSGSQHMKGQAADITVGDREGNRVLFDRIVGSGIPFDQLIDESGYAWIHVSYRGDGNRRQVLHLK